MKSNRRNKFKYVRYSNNRRKFRSFKHSQREDFRYIQDSYTRGGIRLKLSKSTTKMNRTLIKLIIKATIDKFHKHG